MYNDSVISVCGSMNSTNEQNLFQSSKIIVNGVALLGTLNLHGDSKLYATGGAEFAGRINAYDNSIVNVDNAIMCNDLVWLEGHAKVYANASFTAKGLRATSNNIIQANGITFTQTDDKVNQFGVHCRLESWGDIIFNCYVCVERDGFLVAKGYIKANGIFKDGKGNNGQTGFDIEGVVYSCSDVITAYPLKINSGKLYCTGNVEAATTKLSSFNEAVQVKGTSELYVTGVVTSTIGRRFKLYSDNGGQGSTVSIFGANGTTKDGYINALSSKIDEFTNEQPNSRVYLGDGTFAQTTTNSYLSFSKQFINAGSLYLYGSLSISNNFVGNNGGLTLVGGNMTMSYGAINLSDSHTLIVLGYLSSNSTISVNSASKLYVANHLTTNGLGGASVTLNDNSYMIVGDGSQNSCNSISINSGSKLWSLAPVWTTNVVNVESTDANNFSEFFSNGKHTKRA